MPLGFFQFDNLLKSRVQFFVFSIEDLLQLGYIRMEKMHLERIAQIIPAQIDVSGLKALFEAQGLDKNAPILLVDRAGEASQKWAEALESDGYINLFWMVGGYKDLKAEKDLSA